MDETQIEGFIARAKKEPGFTDFYSDARKAKDHPAKLLSSGNHSLSLINDVLDMSRIESGKIYLEEQEDNLSGIFHDIKTVISGQIHAKQLELYADIMDVTQRGCVLRQDPAENGMEPQRK